MSSVPNLAPPAPIEAGDDHPFFVSRPVRKDLKRTAVRGVAANLGAQGTQFLLGIGSTAVLARLLTPADFGLVAMTTAFTGFVMLFSDGGLALATVQREKITHAQVSTLFWINVVLGFVIASILFLGAPLIAGFYGEPRLINITRALAASFVLTGSAVQHRALMRRQFQFNRLALVDVIAVAAGVTVAVTMGWCGYGYWSLVGMSVTMPFVGVTLLWILVPWRPGWPSRGVGAKPMLQFGGDVLSYNILTYVRGQADLALIGWRWGPISVGFYEKACRMLLMPLRQVSLPLAAVLVPALSRLTADPPRMARFYLRALELLTGVTIPIVFALAVFADELVLIWLGPQWMDAARLFRLLGVAAVVAVMINPTTWLVVAMGHTRKYKWMGLASSCAYVTAFAIGVRNGASGVAIAYSIVSGTLLIPMWAFALHGTPVSLRSVARALLPSVAGALPAMLAGRWLLHAELLPGMAAVALAVAGYGVVYLAVLFGLFGRWQIYASVITGLKKQPRFEPAA